MSVLVSVIFKIFSVSQCFLQIIKVSVCWGGRGRGGGESEVLFHFILHHVIL